MLTIIIIVDLQSAVVFLLTNLPADGQLATDGVTSLVDANSQLKHILVYFCFEDFPRTKYIIYTFMYCVFTHLFTYSCKCILSWALSLLTSLLVNVDAEINKFLWPY